MKITIDHLNDMHMEAQNEEGGLIRMDGSTEIGGLEGGFSPMQLLLAGVGGCSAIDIIGILKKQRQDLQDLKVEVDGDRQSKDEYSEFTNIHGKNIRYYPQLRNPEKLREQSFQKSFRPVG